MAEKVMHGPMWQFECKTCGYMGDCWDIEREAAEEMQDHKCVDRLPSWAREEMERLRTALALAIGELSTYGPMRYTSPDQLMEHFMREARRG